MKNKIWLLLAGVLLLNTGCARLWVVKLNNGVQVAAHGKPVYRDGAYYFKDASGKETHVPGGSVLEMEPASMAAKDKGFNQ